MLSIFRPIADPPIENVHQRDSIITNDAIIHNDILVFNPAGDGCTVSLSYRASPKNVKMNNFVE